MNWIHRHYKRILVILGLGIGLVQAKKLAWISDDAYISFIYARNFAEGKGLVFQAGERVEGFTNFLWTLLLSLAHPLGMRMEDFSVFLGILFYAMLLLSIRNPWLIFSYSLFYFGWEFATSGLETGMFAFFITLSYQFLRENKAPEVLASSALLPLVRPEGALFVIANVVFLLVKNRKNGREFLLDKKFILSAIFSIFLFFLYIYKMHYYGDIFPNTFYAKAGEGSYFRQGWLYFYYFHREYIVLSLFLLVGLVFSRNNYSWVLLVYLGYVFYIGGDFMFSRFFIPVIPVALIITWEKLQETGVSWEEKFGSRGKKFSLAVLGLFILSPLFQTGLFTRNAEGIYLETGISHERKIYSFLGRKDLVYDEGIFRDRKVSFWGAQAHFIYYMRPELAIESTTGLTDPWIARQTLSKRGPIGHEKKAPLSYLRERGVEIVMADVYPELSDPSHNLVYIWNGNRLLWKIVDPLSNPELIESLRNHPHFEVD